MAPNLNDNKTSNPLDKMRVFFGYGGHRKNKASLPGRTHFSIWYFLLAFLLIS